MMMRTKKFWVSIPICVVLLTLVPGLSGVQRAPLYGQPFSSPIFVLLYHPQEEGFSSTFRDHLNWLKQNQYETIPLETLLQYLKGEEASLPINPILLTFDDGTIENYEAVYPMLKEFGFIGTAFVITGLPFAKFSNRFWWREVDRSNVLRIENHSQTHHYIWISPHIVNFYSGEDPGDYWLITGMDWRLGAPIYEYGYELIDDQYLPDRRIADFCVNYVRQHGGQDFFDQADWKEQLFQRVEDLRKHQKDRGRYERKEQRERRIQKEIEVSKRIIEQTIGHGKEVKFFAYPWGAYDDELILQLKGYGYQGAFTTDWGGNYPGDDPFKIKRFVVTSEMTGEDLSNILESE
jgi:peptidoglycan/xylan/chitin deacetylase (PgdA/CDA1 family)